jgi:peptidyl-prolyl cis-trans isomerase B (cyclophilin B)
MAKVLLKTNKGDITLSLDSAKAPKSVANFLQYVKSGHYDGTIFHRVIDNFMIQGGGMEPGMKQKPTGDEIENEANNGLKNERGTIAMARTSDPHSATAQFFINVNDNDFLNHTAPSAQGWGYAVFGKVSDGMDVVDAIRKVKTGNSGFHQDVPTEDVVIEKAIVLEE